MNRVNICNDTITKSNSRNIDFIWISTVSLHVYTLDPNWVSILLSTHSVILLALYRYARVVNSGNLLPEINIFFVVFVVQLRRKY